MECFVGVVPTIVLSGHSLNLVQPFSRGDKNKLLGLIVVAVLRYSDSEISDFEFLDGKMRGGACGMFCMCCSHDRVEWSFPQVGSTIDACR